MINNRPLTSNVGETICKIALLLLLCATTIGGFLWLPPAQGFMNPALARIVVFHVPCSIVAYLASGVATWYAIQYLRLRRPEDDIKSRASFGLALLFWILTTATGMIFAKVQWGAYWNWDIKQGAILMLTLIYMAYFALRAAITDPRKQATLAAGYAVFAVLSAPFLTLVLPNSTPNTLHPKGVLEHGLSPEYSLVLWGGVLGLSLVYWWAWRVQVALELLELRLHRRARTQASMPSATVTRAAS
jgi:heme exporter protein C